MKLLHVAVVAALSAAVVAAQDRAPNVLLIIADDVTYNDLPLYGGPNIETPNIDRLAAQGLTFNRAYLSMAMCNPSRTELYTGLYPFRNGSTWNHSAAREGTQSIVHHMGRLGYRVGLSGKKHVLPESSFGFEDVPGVPNPRTKIAQPEFDTSELEAFMSRDADQPFFLVTAFHEAHSPWSVGRPEAFDLDELALPENLADTRRTREHFATYLAEIVVLDWEVGRLLEALDASGQAENTIVLFTSEQGSHYPGSKWTNWNTGVHTALTVRWPGRIPAGERTDALVQYADVLPTLMDAAGGDWRALDGTSFLQVLLGEHNQHREYAYLMHNNVPEGPPYPIRAVTDGTWHYIRNLMPERVFMEKHLMGGYHRDHYWNGWLAASGPSPEHPANRKAIELINRFMHRPGEELYRTPDDPFHMNNRIGDRTLRDVRDRLAAALGRWMQSQGDPGAAIDTEEHWRAGRESRHLTDVMPTR